jgi:putative redox protein
MSVEINAVYQGDLHCQATHGPSGHQVCTDAPVDNAGKGECFSPTDLVATAVGTCMLTLMGLVAKRSNLDISGTRVKVLKEMASAPARRIGALDIVITVPNSSKLSQADRDKLQRAADTCPVKQSLHPDVKLNVRYEYL